MKILMILSIGLLAAALGCQSAEPPVSTPDTKTPAEQSTESKTIAKADDHSEEDENKAPRITLEEAKKSFDEGDAVFVDTRGSTFYENEHVKGAFNVPASDFEATYKSVPKDKKIIAYCS